MARRNHRIAAGVLGLAALTAAAGGGFIAGQQRAEAPQTRLSLATCGLVPAPEPLDLPLAALMRKAGAPGLTLGPILHPGLDAPLSVVFRPQPPGTEAPPLQTGQTLTLPLDIDRLPDEVRLSCRHGTVARVSYRNGPLRQTLEVATADSPAPDASALPGAQPPAVTPPLPGSGPRPDSHVHPATAPAAPPPEGAPPVSARVTPAAPTAPSGGAAAAPAPQPDGATPPQG